MEKFTATTPQNIDGDTLIAQVEKLSFNARPPFAPVSLAALGDLSKKLMRSPLAAQAPQLVSLGFWLRPSQLSAANARFEAGLSANAQGIARGIALHLPPQNVDTLFVYSWALSLLAGNVNVVRLPSELTTVLRWLVPSIIEILDAHGLGISQIFCSYPHSSDMTARLSALADLRMIWGGDEKISTVSRIPVRPDGLSLGFSDRKSFSVISAATYAQMIESDRDNVAGQLFNDIYWFDQMGCGSPRVIFWLGAPGEHAQDLYLRLDAVAASKNYVVETGTALAKFGHMNETLASGLAHKGTLFSNRLSVLQADIQPTILEKTQGAGMLYDVTIDQLSDIAPFLSRQTQTITHVGLTNEEIGCLSDIMSTHGGFRLVPAGEALLFSDIWDGIDLMTHMTRQVSIRP